MLEHQNATLLQINQSWLMSELELAFMQLFM